MGLSNSAWPKFHHNIKNTGQSPYSSYSDGTIKWIHDAGSGSFYVGSPAIALDGTVYIGGFNNLRAINPDGTVKWIIPEVIDWWATPAIDADGIIYITDTDNSKLHAVNPDGTLKWSYPVLDYGYSSSAIATDGTIYQGNYKSLFAINPNGTLKWEYNVGTYFRGSSPSIAADGTIYIATSNKKLNAITRMELHIGIIT